MSEQTCWFHPHCQEYRYDDDNADDNGEHRHQHNHYPSLPACSMLLVFNVFTQETEPTIDMSLIVNNSDLCIGWPCHSSFVETWLEDISTNMNKIIILNSLPDCSMFPVFNVCTGNRTNHRDAFNRK